MFLTLHQKFANMTPTLFPSRRRPSHGRSSTSLHACLPPPSHGPIAPARSGALRRAPARSVLVVSEFAPLAATARASRQSSVSSTVRRFPNQGQQTVVRRPHPKDPRETPPCPMLSHDRVGVAYSDFATFAPSYCLLIRSPPKYRLRDRFSPRVIGGFPRFCQKQADAGTTNKHSAGAPPRAPTKQASPLAHQLSLGHLLPSEGARAACRSCHVARPPPARFRGRGPDARIVCFFSARLLVGSRSLAPASRAARPRRSFSRRRLAGDSCHHRDPSVPSRRGSLRGRRRRPEPRGAGRLSRASDGFFDRASSFPCRIGDPAFVRLLSRRSRIDARRAGRFRRSCTRIRGRGLVAALERERRTPGPSARPSRRGNHLFRSAKYPAPGANYLSSFSRVGALFP